MWTLTDLLSRVVVFGGQGRARTLWFSHPRSKNMEFFGAWSGGRLGLGTAQPNARPPRTSLCEVLRISGIDHGNGCIESRLLPQLQGKRGNRRGTWVLQPLEK